MNRVILAAVIALSLVACNAPGRKDPPPGTLNVSVATPVATPAAGSTAPAGARLAAYRYAIVKDLVIEESAFAYVRNNEDRAALEANKAALIADFSNRFRDELAKRHYFESLAAAPGTENAVIVQPRAIVMDPGVQTNMLMGTPTRIEIMVSITDAASGAAVGSYLTPTQFLPKTNLPVVNRLQSYFPAASAKLADGMATLR